MAANFERLVPFPTVKNPSKAKISGILQIEFSVQRLKKSDLIEIRGFNNLRPLGHDNPYPWRTMPSAYTIYLSRAFFRLENLKYAVMHAKGNDQEIMLPLKRHLLHLDATLDQIWEEVREADLDDNMDAQWRSKTFDQWLTIDFHVQRHNPFDVNAFIEEDAVNIGKLLMDPFDLNWDEYDSSMPMWLSGSAYQWDVAEMKQKCPMDKVAEYYYLYFGLDDDGARTLLWDVFGKDTNKGTSKRNKGKSRKTIKVKVEKIDGGKEKGKDKVDKVTKTKIQGKGKGKKDDDDHSMDVDVESEDDAGDKDAEGEVVDDEEDVKVNRKPRKTTTFRPKAITKPSTIGTRSSKRLKLDAPAPLITTPTSGSDPSDAQDLAALLIVKASSSTTSVSPVSAVQSPSSAETMTGIETTQICDGNLLGINVPDVEKLLTNNDLRSIPGNQPVLVPNDQDSLGVLIPDAHTMLSDNGTGNDTLLRVGIPDAHDGMTPEADTALAQNAFALDLASCYTNKD